MSILNVFKSDAFSVATLSRRLNNKKYVEGRISALGLFETNSVDTTTISIERQGDDFIIVAPSARGGPGDTIGDVDRDLIPLIVPHFEINDSVMADSVQNIRAFGEEQARETVAGKINQRYARHVVSYAATEENARLGALKGLVTYKGGKTLDLFNTFDVQPNAQVNFAFATNVDGKLRTKCADVTRRMQDQLDGLPFDGIHAFCGDNFFDALLENKELRETYQGWSQAQILRESYIGPRRGSHAIVEFGGIIFENYRGQIGAPTSIPTGEVQLFPVGVPGLFATAYAPADYNETVNTPGQRLYSRQWEMANGKGVHLDSQMNALQYCTRPNVLFNGKAA